MMKNKALILSAGAVFSVLLLPGCEKLVHEPTYVSQSKLQVQEKEFFEDMHVSKMDAGYIAALSQHYSSEGDGGVDLSVTYDPKSSQNTAMVASGELARISDEFRKNGVVVNGTIIPVRGHGDALRAIVSYDTYTVERPDDCTDMPGYSDRNVDADEDYKLGCTRDSLIAKQVARPKDLMGRADTNETSDGRRAANIVEGYRTGAPNKALDGENASE